MNDYLWDRRGSDAEVERMENLLSRYRQVDRSFVFPDAPASAATRARRPFYFVAAVAAMLVIAVALLFWSTKQRKPGVTVVTLQGAPRIDKVPITASTLHVGGRLETGIADRARIQVGDIGWVQVEPGSVLTLIEDRPDRRLFRLERGELRAKINAEPAVFIVETPVARAIDLGCAYRLLFTPGNEGTIEVTDGWVEVDHGFDQMLVPSGAKAQFRIDGISPAYMNQTSPAFRDSMLEWWRARDKTARSTALERALSNANRRDAFTLLNMLRHARPEDREAIYDRLDQFVPAPRNVSRAAVLAGETNAAEAWWPMIERELGLGTIKKKGPLRVSPYWPH